MISDSAEHRSAARSVPLLVPEPELLIVPPPLPVAERRVVVLIPAFNEERFVGSVVLKARKCTDTVLVVDDGSSDATTEVAESAGATVIRHDQNRGKGHALNTGFRSARELGADVVITIDADGQHEPEEIELVAAPVLEGRADIIVGSRYLVKISTVRYLDPSKRSVITHGLLVLSGILRLVRQYRPLLFSASPACCCCCLALNGVWVRSITTAFRERWLPATRSSACCSERSVRSRYTPGSFCIPSAAC